MAMVYYIQYMCEHHIVHSLSLSKVISCVCVCVCHLLPKCLVYVHEGFFFFRKRNSINSLLIIRLTWHTISHYRQRYHIYKVWFYVCFFDFCLLTEIFNSVVCRVPSRFPLSVFLLSLVFFFFFAFVMLTNILFDVFIFHTNS